MFQNSVRGLNAGMLDHLRNAAAVPRGRGKVPIMMFLPAPQAWPKTGPAPARKCPKAAIPAKSPRIDRQMLSRGPPSCEIRFPVWPRPSGDQVIQAMRTLMQSESDPDRNGLESRSYPRHVPI